MWSLSPEPLEVLDAPAIAALLAAGFVVVGAGGGGVPVVRDDDGTLRGVEAVIDKDLAAAVLGHTLDADLLVIATDVDHVVLDFGSRTEQPLHRVGVEELRNTRRKAISAAAAWAPRSRRRAGSSRPAEPVR